MSGHSKWATTKHKKAVVDGRRGKLFTKLIKEITIAARMGGGDPEGNPRLRLAIAKAKEANMPHDNMKRAIQKGTGDLPGESYEEIVYEGYGPGGVAVLMEITTDNKNRTASDIRHIFSKAGGNLGEAGCVAWMFSKKGYLLVSKGGVDEESLMAAALESGAEDIRSDDPESYEVLTAPADFERVRAALSAAKLPVTTAEVTMIPSSTVAIEGKDAEAMIRLMDALDDHDDVNHVYANFDVPQDVLQKVEA
ncbi:MAG: YebC/PmpR family DNA-binding transcriptional regulator [Nitrospirota bacterium]|jgi:YebC/PmpR family DNA-binding regulatory protein